MNDIIYQQVIALYCEGFHEKQIAQMVMEEERKVYQIIERGLEKGDITHVPKLNLKALDSSVHTTVYQTKQIEELKKRLEAQLEMKPIKLTIKPTPRIAEETLRDDFNAEKEALKLISREAARQLSKILFNGKDQTIGFNWGYAVWKVVDNLHPLPGEIGDSQIKGVSLFGDLEYTRKENKSIRKLESAIQLSCNSIITKFVQKLGGRGVAVPLNVPFFIPWNLAEHTQHFENTHKFLTNRVSYKRIFGTRPPKNPMMSREKDKNNEALINEMTTIITGFGAVDSVTTFHKYLTHLLSEKEIAELETYVQAGKIVGDIGGHLVSSQDSKDDAAVSNFLVRINQRILAANPGDFKAIASKHRKNKQGGGVIGIAVGARKAKILHALLAQDPCPVSRLIIDSHCALALLNQMNEQDYRDFIKEKSGAVLMEDRKYWSEKTKEMIPLS